MTGLDPDDLTVVGRILYKAFSCEDWGEYELDYVIVGKKDVKVERNTDEVKNLKYVSRKEIDEFLDERKTAYGEALTPWFKLLKESLLDELWSQSESGKFIDRSEKITRF